MACSLVACRLDYCNAVLHGAPESVIARLQRVQNKIARVAMRSTHRMEAKPPLKALHWLPVKQRTQYKLADTVYKTLMTDTPAYLNELIKSRDCLHTIRLSSLPQLTDPTTNIGLAKMSFPLCRCYTVWNALLATIINSPSLGKTTSGTPR